jgi:RHS repeat-associated protein
MRSAVRPLVGCLLCVVAVLIGSSVLAFGDAPSSVSGPGASMPLEGGLVVPGGLDEGQQQAAEEAKRSNPEAVAAREASLTKYEGLSTGEAAKVAGEAFPNVMDRPAGGPPMLPTGQHIAGYPSVNVAQVDLGGGRRGVIESMQPMAIEASPGNRVPLNLTLTEQGGAFAPSTALVGVRIPKHLGEGVSLTESGVSLTPVDGEGSPLSGSEGSVDGATVLYANTQTDSDTVVKPATGGFETDTLLRSVDSPQQLFFRVGLPEGAELEQQGGSGSVQVVDAGQVIAIVPVPGAVDAEGTIIPVSMAVSGDTLVLTVDHRAGGYRYPIEVDPWVIDKRILLGLEHSNWAYSTDNSSAFHLVEVSGEKQPDIEHVEGSTYKAKQYAYLVYPTQGESHIFAFYANSVAFNPGTGTEATISLAGPRSGLEGDEALKFVGLAERGVCDGTCEPKGITYNNEENRAFFEVLAREESNETFGDDLYEAKVYIEEDTAPLVSLDTKDTMLNGQRNAATGEWMNTTSAVLGVNAFDYGTGIDAVGAKSPNKSEWGFSPRENKQTECAGAQCNECDESECLIYKIPGKPLSLSFAELGELPEGEDTVEATVEDAEGLSTTTAGTIVKVDNAPPHNLTLTGLPSGNEIGEGQYNVKAEATDGSGSTPSSGVKSIAVTVDGREVGKPAGSCPHGPCTAKGEWTINGSEFGTGEHKLKIIATDNVGNVATETFTIKVHHATPVSLGPGAVNPQSGELSLNASDVAISAPGAGLEVARNFRSRHLTAGAEGPLGPQWSLSVGSEESITKLPNGNVTLTSASGGQTTFVAIGKGAFTSPAGDTNLALSEVENAKKEVEYLLKDASSGETTRFNPTSSTSMWKPSKQEGPITSQAVRYLYEPVEGITEPKYALAPEPAGVTTCLTRLEKKEELVKGCRALEFKYATAKTATGENEKEWGEYTGRLKEVLYLAYNPTTKAIAKPAVAHYMYDKQGRLRAEWNPQIEHELKVAYGYDTEGHVTALTSPGQESWTFHYGTIAGDPSTGRLLSITRPSASTGLWGGEVPNDTARPALSGSAVVGIKMSVTNGTWSGGPLAYGYQWEDCNSLGEACSPIQGATNPTYTPTKSDMYHALVVQVAATNGGGTVTAVTTQSSVVGTPVYSSSFGSSGTEAGKFSHPGDVVVDPKGNLWVIDQGNNRVEEFNEKNEYLQEFGAVSKGLGQGSTFKSPDSLALTPENDVWVANTGRNELEKYAETGGYLKSFIEGNGSKFSEPTGIAANTHGELWISDTAHGRVVIQTEDLEGSTSIISHLSKPEDIAVDSHGNAWVADWNEGVVEFNEKGEYLKTVTGSGEDKLEHPYGVAVEPNGNILVIDATHNRVEMFNEAGDYETQFGSTGSGAGEFSFSYPMGLTTNSTGDVWVTDSNNNRIEKWIPPTAGSEGAAPPSPSPRWTIEYHIPLSGTTGLPPMTESEVTKWGQKDDPTEGMAILPPSKPMGWPATEFKEATTYYLDSRGRTVNMVAPTSGISTTEYNSYNDITRTLSPDNRATAVASGEKSKELAKELDSEKTYKETGSEPGTELLSTLGPKHNVELTNGTQAEARTHTTYTYNEGAPTEGGPYHLVTTMTQGAQIAGKEEAESVRTTKTSYSGQSNLGWKLREPTSVTTDPTGLDLVHTTEYEPSTGNVIEIKMPAAAGKDAKVPPAYSSQWGAGGEENGQFNHPMYTTVDSSGNLWVADGYNNRVEKFSSSGTFLAAYGSYGSSETEVQFKEPVGIAINQSTGNVYVGDQNNNRVVEMSSSGKLVRIIGKVGSGHGEFKEPNGIAIDPKGNIWVVDCGNNRIQELNEAGEYQKEFGGKGSENGKFNLPEDIALSGEDIYVTDLNNSRVEEFSEEGKKFVRAWGSFGTGNGKFEYPSGITVGPNGNVYVANSNNDPIQEFSSTGNFLLTFGTKGSGNGQFDEPEGISVLSSGTIYIADAGNDRVEKWVTPVTGSEGAHNTKTIYYTTAANTEYKECGEHAEWANLPCLTKPAAQPGTAGLPELPITKNTAYNVWDEPEATTEAVGSTTRTKTDSYDEAGRLKSSVTTSTVGTTLPTVTDTYNNETGALEKESTTGKTITNTYNTLGQLTAYADASEVTATYEYDVDGRIHKTNDGKGTQTYTYNEAGLVSELVDSSAAGMKFTATYDAEGNMLTEGYPNGMNANYTYNADGTPTALEYKKITHCTEEKEKCKWFTDMVMPSIHGQLLSQTSTLSKQAYSYDQAGRLTQVQNTPTGGDCTTHVYAYDEDTNRTSLTTRNSSSEKCATEGGSTEWHTYDTADRLTGTGLSYNTFGDITAVPALGTEDPELTSAYYVDNQLASQKQKEQTIGYNLDPAGRTLETVSTGKPLVADITFNYAAPSGTPSWTNNATVSEWSRNIPGINGSLVAIQNNGTAPVLQLTNLHGDIIATASTSETATELASKTDTSEFGVPTVSSPPTYSWLGADGLRTELPSGAIDMGARSYVPQLGRFLQPDPIPGGSANAYSYTFGDPVDTSDPSGEYTATIDEFDEQHVAGRAEAAAAVRAAEIRAAEEAAARVAAEVAAYIASVEAADAAEAAELAASYSPESYEEESGGGGGRGRFASHEDPGVPPGAQCTGSVDSKKYKKEHKKLCGEIESNPLEPADILCEGFWWTNPAAAAVCGVYGSGRYFTSHH